MSRRFIFLFAIALVAAGTFVGAQAPKPVTQGEMVSTTSVIQAIDSANRLVTLKNEDGTTDVIYCGPEVKRFNELKVGDKVTFRYHESVVASITQAGASAATTSLPQIVRSAGAKPGATISQQATAVVTVAAIDPKIPSITITTSDGNKLSFKVENKKNIEGVKVGDKVQITYTQAFAVTVEPPGK
jgi:Cu/Ag efflux protein CusF